MVHLEAASSESNATTAAAAAVASTAATNLFGLNFMSDPSSGPILYMEPNRTPVLEDIRSVIIYISFATLLFGFFIILPGIRHDKIPTFVFIPTSLFVTASIFIALNGTTWHVGEAPISAAYKAFSKDRIQGDISVKIGLQSVNITLNAHKYYLLHSSQGPMMMENNLTMNNKSNNNKSTSEQDTKYIKGQKYSIKRINVDINYNERFYWIEPNQMRQEHHNALKRGLPYPILTVVEYLSQDEAAFSWSRQYRQAGYYTYILLCLTLSCCLLMFLFHCAAPTYAIYTLITIGSLLLLTNFTYAMLVPRGNQSLVIPFEGQRLTFNFGFDFKLTFIAGCISIVVGSILAVVNYFWPLTTILDHDFDAHQGYYRHQRRKKDLGSESGAATPPSSPGSKLIVKKPSSPPTNLTKNSPATATTAQVKAAA